MAPSQQAGIGLEQPLDQRPEMRLERFKAGADAAASAAALVAASRNGERAAFCCSRPPGHHAGADVMGGYCFLNNAAVAAQSLRDAGAARVAILDVDDHHGNGTQSIF